MLDAEVAKLRDEGLRRLGGAALDRPGDQPRGFCLLDEAAKIRRARVAALVQERVQVVVPGLFQPPASAPSLAAKGEIKLKYSKMPLVSIYSTEKYSSENN